MAPIFQTDGFMPRGGCHYWTPDVLFHQVVGNLGVLLAYVAIPVILLLFLRRAPELPSYGKRFVALFGTFVLVCGLGHGISAIMVWWPAYRFEGFWITATALLSLRVAWVLPGLLKQVLTAIIATMRYERLVEHVSDGHWVYTVDTDTDWVSKRYLEVLGLSSFGDHTDDWLDRIHPDEKAHVQATFAETLATGKPFEAIYRILHAQGHYAWHLDRGCVFRDNDGKITHIMGAHTDVTEMVQSQNRFRRVNADLEQFAYVASHDLKEPIRMMVMISSLLLEDNVTSNERLMLSKELEKAGRRANALIRDLLEFSRASKIDKFLPVGVRTLIQRATDTFAIRVRELAAKIEVEVSDDVTSILGSESLLQQMIENTIGNSLKFHNENVTPRIKIKASQVGMTLQIKVSDNGIGIEAKYLAKVLEPFRRLYSEEKYEGTGIGLSLIQRVAVAHGGRVDVTSAGRDQGTQVTMTLPLAQ